MCISNFLKGVQFEILRFDEPVLRLDAFDAAVAWLFISILLQSLLGPGWVGRYEY